MEVVLCINQEILRFGEDDDSHSVSWPSAPTPLHLPPVHPSLRSGQALPPPQLPP